MDALLAERPCGMHRRTFDRLVREAKRAEELADEHFLRKTARYLANVAPLTSPQGSGQRARHCGR